MEALRTKKDPVVNWPTGKEAQSSAMRRGDTVIADIAGRKRHSSRKLQKKFRSVALAIAKESLQRLALGAGQASELEIRRASNLGSNAASVTLSLIS